MKETLARFLDRLPYISGLRRQVDRQGLFPAGHYSSPIPSRADVERHLEARQAKSARLAGIDLREEQQLACLGEWAGYYHELPWAKSSGGDLRYSFEQEWFGYADAIYLFCFLRHHRPANVIEIGSGHSSAVILDIVERFLPGETSLTFVEPDPARLEGILRPRDLERVDMVGEMVQSAPPGLFRRLRAGDLLFVDSSHVAKCGSDVIYLLFEVLPRLPPGAFVCFHDVFWPFDYPEEWLQEGRYWNEVWFLRAYLMGNRGWRIHFFGDYIAQRHRERLAETMPLCLKNTGASLYLQKVGD